MGMERDPNLIALSAEFHTNPKYAKFYEKYCDDLQGFIGVYDMIRDMAIMLTDWERKQLDPWEGYDWV